LNLVIGGLINDGILIFSGEEEEEEPGKGCEVE
jgi:hypothetical protein